MSDPALGLLMLALIVVVIMLGFPTAFTLMGLGMFFGYIAFYDSMQLCSDNRVFDLMVQRTYGAMTNDVLISIPLFVLMGYVMERGALVDKMFYSIQLAFRNVPASLAVATLIVCTFWGIASGLVGAVVVLMGVIAFNPMLKAGYDVKLASGVITAGGTLGILIPPSVMIIVYAAVAGQSVVKLYAAAMFPGFFQAFLYLVYVIGWALINPKIAPPLSEEQTRVKVPAWITKFGMLYSPNMFVALLKALVSPAQAKTLEADGKPITYGAVVKNFIIALVPFLLTSITLSTVWWYVVIHQQAGAAAGPVEGLQQLGSAVATPEATPAEKGPDFQFYLWFGISAAVLALWTARSYWRMNGERFEVLKLLTSSVLSLDMTPVQFMILSQAIIFVLGWPLEWTEIIIIFVPIFLPMLKHFGSDPILCGTLVFVNLQAAFLSPPLAMSAFYLKGVAPKHVTLNQIFAGMIPYILLVILCMVIMYLWPGMTLWLPNYLYGG